MNLLQQHNWPGNVRELENAVERAMVVAQEPELHEQDFTVKLKNGAALDSDARSLEDVERATSCESWKNAEATRPAPPKCLASTASPFITNLRNTAGTAKRKNWLASRANEKAATAAGGNSRCAPARMVASGTVRAGFVSRL